MRRNFLIALLLSLSISALIIAVVLGTYSRHVIQKTLDQTIEDYISQVELSLHENDQLQQILRSELNNNGEKAILAIADTITQWPPEKTLEQWKQQAEKFGVHEIYIIDHQANIIETSDQSEIGLNLNKLGPDFISFLNTMYGSGEVFFAFNSISYFSENQTHYIYYSPKESDYILEIAYHLDLYYRNRYTEELYQYIYQDFYDFFPLNGEYLKEIEIYGIFQGKSISYINPGKKIDLDLEFFNELKQQGEMRITKGPRLIVYKDVTAITATSEYSQESSFSALPRVLVMTFDCSLTKKYTFNFVAMIILITIAITTVSFLVISPFFKNKYIDRMLKINDGLEQIAKGNYENEVVVSGNDEISQMAAELNQMAREISRREKNLLEVEEQLIQSQKMDAIGKLAGGIAHDFNNLLQIILGYSDLAKEKLEKGHPTHEAIGHIADAGERAQSLVQRLLSFSRKDKQLNLTTIDLNEMLRNLMRMLHRILGENIELSFLPGELVPPIQGDVNQIEQAILNLCINARDAMPKGGKLHLEVSMISMDSETAATITHGRAGEFVCISVSDNGCGMTPEVKRQIFEPFYTTKSREEGTGLGLATAHAIINNHRGFISVYSEPDKGSVFRVFLPITLDSRESSPKIELAEAAEIQKGTQQLILLAEDELHVARLGEIILSEAGYRVHVALDGEQAIQFFKQNHQEVSLLILDVIMPKKSGKDVADEAKRINPDVPIIFCSGYTSNILGDDFEGTLFQKPYQRRELLSIVAKALKE